MNTTPVRYQGLPNRTALFSTGVENNPKMFSTSKKCSQLTFGWWKFFRASRGGKIFRASRSGKICRYAQ